MAIKVFTSKHCQPCHDIEKIIKEGKFAGEREVELIDIETDEGFAMFKKEVLDFGDGAVPSAYKDGKKCVISITEDDGLLFNCPTEPHASGQD
jgi:predicted thioredoxin/glutaredoxin